MITSASRITIFGALDRRELLLEPRVVGMLVELRQQIDVVEEFGPDAISDQLGQARIALHQPAARRHAVGLVVDPLRIEFVEVAEDRLLHQLGVQRRHAVDRVAADERQLSHADTAAAALVDQRDVGDLLVVEPRLGHAPRRAPRR